MENTTFIHPFRLIVSTSEGKYFFLPEDIVRLEASSNYTYIHLTNRAKVFTARVLKDFVSHLEPMGFIRTHRTHLVNREHIASVSPEGKVIMRDDSIAEISRRKRGAVSRALVQGIRA
jgi:two-component system LytT family response regulator